MYLGPQTVWSTIGGMYTDSRVGEVKQQNQNKIPEKQNTFVARNGLEPSTFRL